MQHYTAIVSVLTIIIGLFLIVGICIAIMKIDFPASAKDQWNWTIAFFVSVAVLLGAFLGASPLTYPHLAKVWNVLSLDLASVNPIDAPEQGKDFEIKDGRISNLKPIGDLLLGVATLNEDDVVTSTKFVREESSLPSPKKGQRVEVFLQHRVDRRTSSGIIVEPPTTTKSVTVPPAAPTVLAPAIHVDEPDDT